MMPIWLEMTFVAALGLVFGSFVTLASYRLPRDEPVVNGRSRCPSCKTFLGVAALVPLFSWIFQKGKCRYCKKPVSARYPLTELTQAALFLLVYAVYGVSWQSGILVLFTVCLLIMIVVDFEWMIIPDEVQIAMLVLGCIYHAVMGTAFESVLASAALGLGLGLALHYGYRFLMNKDGLGFGDVKFLLVAGVWLADPLLWPPFLFVSGVWGIVTALVWRVLGKGPRFPFGPALAAALLLSLLVPVRELFYWTMRAIYA